MMQPNVGQSLFALGFRPFFMLAGVVAVLLVAYWVMYFQGYILDFGYYGAMRWHSHEMIFAYAVAVIAGFLLTAVRNWTGAETLGPSGLKFVSLLWVLGRLSPFLYPLVPGWVVACIDLSFLPCVGIAIAIPILRTRNYHNLFFIPIFMIFTFCNLVIHLDALGIVDGMWEMASRCSLGLVIIVVTVIAGRVIPFFSKSAISNYRIRQYSLIEWGTFVSTISFVLTYVLEGDLAHYAGYCALAAAIFNGLRIYFWYDEAIWRHPLLWVLYIAYTWLIVGYGLSFYTSYYMLGGKLAIHALTVGAIGGITLGMMVRVTLGHTGRSLEVGFTAISAFVLLNMGAMTRVILPILSPDLYAVWIATSGIFWVAAFMLFLKYCGPMLITPRVDGKSG